MARIFISYKRADKEKVFTIKEEIESALGERCWIDIDGIESDAQFKNVIISAINDCEIVLFMYSKTHSKIVDFEKDWTVRELNFASKKNKRIVFINLDGSTLTDSFEFDYGIKQQLDARNQNNIRRLITDLRSWLRIDDSVLKAQEEARRKYETERRNAEKQRNELSMKKMIDERIIIKLQNNIQDKKENSTNKFVNVHQNSEWLDDALKSNKNFSTIFDHDPNTEVVNFVNEEVPIVMFYGPPAVGKTMTIIRLARYLLEHGYTVVPNKVFRLSDYSRYQSLCDSFSELLNSGSVAQGTDIGGTMLIDIIKNGKTIIQFLDTTGEMVDLNDDDKEIEYPSYFTQFINTKNPKMWLVLLEPHFGDVAKRETYSNRIKKLRCCYSRTEDDFVFVYNKIDLTSFFVSYGKVYDKAYINDIKVMYPGLLNFFQIRNPIRKIFQKYSCRILPFQTGSYHLNKYGNQLYIPGPVEYVEELWKVIRYSIK